jgi:hypothetical protein
MISAGNTLDPGPEKACQTSSFICLTESEVGKAKTDLDIFSPF